MRSWRIARATFPAQDLLYQRALDIFDKQPDSNQQPRAGLLYRLAGLVKAQGDTAVARSVAERAVAECENASVPTIPRPRQRSACWRAWSRSPGTSPQHDVCVSAPLRFAKKYWVPRTEPRLKVSQASRALPPRKVPSRKRATVMPRVAALSERSGVPTPRLPASLGNNFACFLRDHGEQRQARTLFTRAIAICDDKLGREHPYSKLFAARVRRRLDRR